jgi:hypothetical protein
MITERKGRVSRLDDRIKLSFVGFTLGLAAIYLTEPLANPDGPVESLV